MLNRSHEKYVLVLPLIVSRCLGRILKPFRRGFVASKQHVQVVSFLNVGNEWFPLLYFRCALVRDRRQLAVTFSDRKLLLTVASEVLARLTRGHALLHWTVPVLETRASIVILVVVQAVLLGLALQSLLGILP